MGVRTKIISLMVALALAMAARAESRPSELPAGAADAGLSAARQQPRQPNTPPGESSALSASGLLNLPPANDSGAQKAAQLLEQMVAALGGQAYLNLQDMQQVGRAFSFYHGESSGAGALFWRFWRWPDKERIELTKQRDWFIIYNGDKGYETTFRGTAAVEPETLQEYLRRRSHSLPWVLRKWLREPGVALFYEGQAMAERKRADQVSVLNAQNEGTTIYIDTATHLPLKVSFVWRDPKTRDRNEESEGYDNYRTVQGIATPFNITRYKNGDMVNQRFITETRYNQAVADSLFEPKPNVNAQAMPNRKK
jgi:hypothetical protein